eukprot:scaffold30061_cov17-Prasinocladus_malaysianus.AAC.1
MIPSAIAPSDEAAPLIYEENSLKNSKPTEPRLKAAVRRATAASSGKGSAQELGEDDPVKPRVKNV